MNKINKSPVDKLGYDFVEKKYIPKGEDEYYLRNQQNKSNAKYRQLKSSEIEILIRNGNNAENWDNVLVSSAFNPVLIKRCSFYGLVRMDKMETVFLEFHSFKMQVGLYDSTIISCDLGENVCINNVQYLSHYIVGNEVMIANVNELATTSISKFGSGILKEGEEEEHRVWMELCNENGARRVLPFSSMLPGDAYLWSKYRADEDLMNRFVQITENDADRRRGHYGVIGDRTVIKNCAIIKDVNVGTDAYLKGANKLKNLTINSDADRTSQIGEGCEMVNGIVGYGCRIFYGAKAVRFVMASHSQLKYGARLINSYLGNNSTISCCEVLNSLIFPGHEQHHNNSFLCASLVMGQSNIAAGATIGSNHNSRSPDGEIVAGRGFWPGLCISLKHNSKFASFAILAKADYPAELNIPLPFSLISNDVFNNMLIVMPGYWFMYNMYALERNTWKYINRDRRTERIQNIEYNYLAPDTINEIFTSLELMSALKPDAEGCYFMDGLENTNRRTQIVKLPEAIELFKKLIVYYSGCQLLSFIKKNKISSFADMKKGIPTKIQRSEWINIGGQLMTNGDVEKLQKNIKSKKIDSWKQVHDFYKNSGLNYETEKLIHAYTSLLEVLNITSKQFDVAVFNDVLNETLSMKEWMCKGIYDSRAKDYSNPFRKMVYETSDEMNSVIGKIEDNSFIQQQLKELDTFKKEIAAVRKKVK